MITTVIAREIDQIDQATPHMYVDHQRLDGGGGETRIDVAHHGVAERIDVSFGFSMAGAVTAADSSLVITTPSLSSANGSVWDGSAPEPGELWVYGPGSAQVGLYAAGSGSHTVSVPWASLQRAATTNRINLDPWQGRRAHIAGPQSHRLVEALRDGFCELDEGSEGAELLRTVLLTLTDPPSYRVEGNRLASSREITRDVLHWIEVTGGWFPSLAEVCEAVGVSERRLRYAFADVFHIPPSRYLRLRALNAVRSELHDPASLHRSISYVATRHGFRHLSLFARHYRHTFGENPTETRRRALGWGTATRDMLGRVVAATSRPHSTPSPSRFRRG